MNRGNWFKTRRLELGFTQRQIAAIAGTTEVTVRNWESGRVFPDPRLVRNLQRAYRASFNQLAIQITRLAATIAPRKATRNIGRVAA
jgi:transcriptional regulator with XRE-family HTH domain